MKSPMGLNAELPVADLLREALVLLWQKRSDVLRLFFPAMLILAFVDWAGNEWLEQGHGESQVLFILVSVVLSILFATAAHRFTLLPAAGWNRNALHVWRRDEFRYLLRAIQIGVISGIAFFALMLLVMLTLGRESAWMGAVAGALPAVYLWARLSVTLPELALGRPSTLRRAWRMSEGNGSRLVLVVIVIPVLMMLPCLALYALDSAVMNYIGAFSSYLTSLVSLVILSLSYRFLLGFSEPEAAEVAVDQHDSPSSGFDA